MKTASLFLVLSLTACGARVDAPPPTEQKTEPPATTEPPSTTPSTSGLLRTEPELCAFGAGAGHVVWIEAGTHAVKVARAVEGSEARHLGTAANPCALSVLGTRLCFGDSAGSLTCMNVDGAGLTIEGERKASDPVRAIDLGRDRGLIFARRRTVYTRLYEERLDTKTTLDDVVAVAGDFEPSPDDGVELAVATVSRFQRISYGESEPIPMPAPLAVRALHYSSYLILGGDGVLRTLRANEGTIADLGIGEGVQAVTHNDRAQGENLVIARNGEIVAMSAQLYFEARVSSSRVVAKSNGDVVSLAIDEDWIVWATRAGEIHRAKRRIE